MKDTRKLIIVIALAVLNIGIGYAETFIPSPVSSMPFVKLEISLWVAMLALMLYGVGEAILVYGVKCLVLGLIMQSPSLIIFSLVGGALALCVMFVGLLVKMGNLPSAFLAGVGYAFGYYSMVAAINASGAVFSTYPQAALLLGAFTLLGGIGCHFAHRYIPKRLISDQA